ncbi:response regulator transcription factor [Bryocella elongata]|uniref:response regulator transcription factor n=1 Tax=Bryocella elongata TaxID=863522 RepID=UPI0013593142|nr:response regulator transcription factor [Bryocella elongata]
MGIVAADPLRSLGLEAILETEPRLEPLVIELDKVLSLEDLSAVLLDERSTGGKLTEVIARLRRDRIAMKIIVMGEMGDPDHVQAVIAAGAKGYLAETAGESEIRMCLEVVLDGSVWAPRKVLARLIDAGGVQSVTQPQGQLSGDSVENKMTPRELDVLRLLMDGRSNRDIAVAMGIDEVTVKAHLGRMLRKAGASNRVELTLRAMEERRTAMGQAPRR